jgi:hypothetical protein
METADWSPQKDLFVIVKPKTLGAVAPVANAEDRPSVLHPGTR